MEPKVGMKILVSANGISMLSEIIEVTDSKLIVQLPRFGTKEFSRSEYYLPKKRVGTPTLTRKKSG